MNRFVVACVVAALLAPRITLAQSRFKPEAEAKLASGTALAAAGKMEAALADFRAAYALDPQPDLLYALALAERRAGRCEASLAHLREYLRTNPSDSAANSAKIEMAECWLSMQPKNISAPIIVVGGPELPWYKSAAGGAAVIGTLGVATLAVGVGYLIESRTTRDQASSAQFSDDFDRLLDEATGERRIGAAFMISGAVIGAGALGYYFWKRPKPTEPTTTVLTDGRSILFARTF